jgi:uncharacterized membrane protein
MDYLLIKWVHILSSTVLFGTGLGIAFFQWSAHRRGEIQHIAHTARTVVVADAVFTAPAVVLQFITGWWLMQRLGLGFDQFWLAAALGLYLLAGACWLPVLWLQIRARDLALAAARQGTPLPAAYHRVMRWWFALGWPAFMAVFATFWLMVRKPAAL